MMKMKKQWVVPALLLCAQLILADGITIRQSHPGTIDICAGTNIWQQVQSGAVLKDGYTVRYVANQSNPWVVLEKEDPASGELLYVYSQGKTTNIKKLLGTVGPHSDPEPFATHPKSFWDDLLKAENDILAEKLLSETTDDPTYARIRALFPPMTKAESFVGMEEFEHEVYVAADGSVAVDTGFHTGFEFDEREVSPALRFLLNDRLVSTEERETTMNRCRIGGYLPAIQTLYRQKDSNLGWEQLVFMGRYQGAPMVFIRFRLCNLSDQQQTFRFSIAPPEGGSFKIVSDQLHVTSPIEGKVRFTDPRMAAKKQAVLDQKFVDVPLYSTIPPAELNDGPAWSITLAAKGSKDLFFCLPGCTQTPVAMNADVLPGAFYGSLKEQYDSWKAFLDKGARIRLPEPGLEDIYYAALIQTVCAVDGQQAQGGSIHYEGFWPYTALHQIRLMLIAGYPDYARRYMDYFMKTRINPDGVFRFDFNQKCYQVSDIGDFLAVLAKHYWYTQDSSLILENKDLINRTIDYVNEQRKKSQTLFPAGDPRHGMVAGSLENDVPDQDYFYSNNAPIAAGLCAYANALLDIARTHPSVRTEAADLKAYADEFFATLRSGFEHYAVERDGTGKVHFWHIHPVIGRPLPYVCKYLSQPKENAYRRFQAQPRTMASDFLSDDEIEGLITFQANHDATVLGVRRVFPERLDDFVSFECAFQQIRTGQYRQFIMKYFGFINALCGRGTWTGFEQSNVVPSDEGANGRCRDPGCKFSYLNGWEGQHPTSALAKMSLEIFAFDDPREPAIWLAGGVSRNWLKEGRKVHAENLQTRFGALDFSMQYNGTADTLTITINPRTDRIIPEIRIPVRDPKGNSPVSAAGTAPCRIVPEKSLLIIGPVNTAQEITVRFSK